MTLLQQIKTLKHPTSRSLIIAVSGFGGSGKSTLAAKLKEQLGNAEVIAADDFIISRCRERSADWSSYDRPRLQKQVLEPALHDESISYQVYDWKSDKLGEWRTAPKSKYIIVEGLSILHPELRKYYDFSIWVDCPLEVATQRGIKRDREWGNDHDDLWLNIWMPNEQDFFDKYQPKRAADFVYTNHIRSAMFKTQFPSMDKLITELHEVIQTTLGDKLCGIYLFGSLVTGDFDPKNSDIDLLAIVESDVTEKELEQLRAAHKDFVRNYPEWNNRIEVAYVGIEAMRDFKTKTARIARISPGEPLHYRDMDAQWLLDWYVVQEQGLTISGPAPATFIPRIERQEFVDMLKNNLPTWRERVKEARHKGYQSYIVLSVCRSLYAVQFGKQASKAKAAEWAAKAYPEWASLTKNSLAWRGLADKSDSPATQADMERFVEFALNLG